MFSLIAALTGAVLIARFLVGPFHLLLPVNAPLNLAGVFGVAVTLAMLTSPRTREQTSRDFAPWLLPVLLVVFVLAWRPALQVGFVADDYILIHLARDYFIQNIGPLFLMGGGDGFYRPIGYLSLGITANLINDSRSWHATALQLHAANTCLVALLGLRLRLPFAAAVIGALLFGIHGARPEAVVWIAARFDQLATLFSLLTLWMFVRAVVDDSKPLLALTAVPLLLACLSKESAYILPLLMAICVVPHLGLKRALLRAAPFAAIVVGLLLYRVHLFGNIGGYVNPQTGAPSAISISPLPALKALFVRLPMVLYFPVNWTQEPGLLLKIAAAACVLALCFVAYRSARQPWWLVLLLLVSILPPLHLLGIGADLGNSRVIYLPSVFFCLLLASAIWTLPSPHRWLTLAAILTFHIAALQHNITAWREVSSNLDQACRDAAAQAVDGRVLLVDGLPDKMRGVPYSNGFPQCVTRVANQPISVVTNAPPGEASGAIRMQWNPATQRLACVQNCR